MVARSLEETSSLKKKKYAGTKVAIFAGENSEAADLQMLALAKQAEREGVPPPETWEKTGWFRDDDKKWKWEIPDDKVTISDGKIVHPKLEEAYPGIFDEIKVEFKPITDMRKYGSFDATTKVLTINSNQPKEKQLSTAIHELDHVVQGKEGFTGGGSPSSRTAINIAAGPELGKQFAYLSRVAARDTQGARYGTTSTDPTWNKREAVGDVANAKGFLKGGNYFKAKGNPYRFLVQKVGIDETLNLLNYPLTDEYRDILKYSTRPEDEGTVSKFDITKRLDSPEFDVPVLTTEEEWNSIRLKGFDHNPSGAERFEAYQKMGGETSARNAENRMYLTAEQRRQRGFFPLYTEDPFKVITEEYAQGGTKARADKLKGFAEGGVVDPKDNPVFKHHQDNLSSGNSVKNEDGTISTIRTIIIGDNEYEYLIPTVWDGRILSDEEAFERAMSAGIDWPKAPAGEEGVSYLQQLDKQIHSGFAEGGVVEPLDSTNQAFAQGGTIERDQMNDQTQEAFPISGHDPVSGNEVPLGSRPEEVRDDIPISVSEGEFVIPADALRYHGIKKFEDLITQAKTGFAKLEEEGRLGGGSEEPQDELPFSDEELASFDEEDGPIGMAEGGVVNSGGYPDYLYGSGTTATDQTSMTASANQQGIEYKEFYDKDGNKVIMPYFNGMAMGVLPEGFVSAEGTDPGSTPNQMLEGGGPDGPATDSQGNVIGTGKAVDSESMTVSELKGLVDRKAFKDTVFGKIVSMHPLGNLVVGLYTKAETNNKAKLTDLIEAKNKDAAYIVESVKQNQATKDKENAPGSGFLDDGKDTGVNSGVTSGVTSGVGPGGLSFGNDTGVSSGVTSGVGPGGLSFGNDTGVNSGVTSGVTSGVGPGGLSFGNDTGVSSGVTSGVGPGGLSFGKDTGKADSSAPAGGGKAEGGLVTRKKPKAQQPSYKLVTRKKK
jgi:hypothetical protein